jgi:hypothetical protein
MFQYGVDNFMDRSATHHLVLAQFFIHPHTQNTYSRQIEQAIRLSPRDPYIGNWYWAIGRVHLLQSRIDEAILWLRRPAGLPVVRAYLASAYALKAETERATRELAEARRLSSNDRYSSIARLRAVGYWGVPEIRELYEAVYLAGLRKAGMPEE